MKRSFLSYFLNYIFKNRTRQGLLFLASFGLFLSSFALLVLQSTMGGLQHNLIERSKALHGDGVLNFPTIEIERLNELQNFLKEKGLSRYSPELELEILVKKRAFFSPLIIHGLEKDSLPQGLKKYDFNELILGYGVMRSLNAYPGDLIRLIDPSQTDALFGDVPSMSSLYVDDSFITDVSEIDSYHGYAQISLVQNLIRKAVYNRLRFYEPLDGDIQTKIQEQFGESFIYESWESKNQTLVYALGLENKVMIFLFSSMSLLIGLSITSALLIFFNKVKVDLASFWILGSSKENINRLNAWLVQIISLSSIVGGLLFALLVLWSLDHFSPEIMPDVFVERRIPVRITVLGVFLSFMIPYLISMFVSQFSLKSFQKRMDFMSLLRGY